MRLIDADVLEYVKFHSVTDWTPTEETFYQRGWNGAIDAIMRNVPTVDAVEVVRCKDCKWWKTNYSWNGNEHKICVKEPFEPLRNAEDFCSRGERKEDDVW